MMKSENGAAPFPFFRLGIQLDGSDEFTSYNDCMFVDFKVIYLDMYI